MIPVDPARISVTNGLVPAHSLGCVITITRGPNVVFGGPVCILRLQIPGAPFVDAQFAG